MGRIRDLFFGHKEKVDNTQYAEMLSGRMPIYSNFGNDIYSSDVVQQAINCIVMEMKKLKPCYIKDNGTDVVPVVDDIQAVLNNPNETMTTSSFIEKMIWTLFLRYNSFVIPTFWEWKDDNGNVKRKYERLTPITGQYQTEFVEDASGKLYVNFVFPTEKYLIKYSDLIHLRLNYSVDEYMGGNEQGMPNHSALIKTLQLNEEMLEGVSRATKASYAVNGVVKINTLIDGDTAEKNLEKLERDLSNNQSGFITLDAKNTYVPINKQIALVDSDTLKFIDEKILRNFGVPLPILTGDYTKAQYEAFYQKTLEPLIIQLSQAFTKCLVSPARQKKGYKIVFYAESLIFMTVSEKLEMTRFLGDGGVLYDNEKRTAFGLMPLPELVGRRTQSLNYVDVNIINQYQMKGNSENGQ